MLSIVLSIARNIEIDECVTTQDLRGIVRAEAKPEDIVVDTNLPYGSGSTYALDDLL